MPRTDDERRAASAGAEEGDIQRTNRGETPKSAM